jgi:YggT family protein
MEPQAQNPIAPVTNGYPVVQQVPQQPVQQTMPVMNPAPQVMPHYPTPIEVEHKKSDFGKIKAILQFLFSFIETLLVIRFVLLLLGARSSDFAILIFSLTDPLVAPFQGTFATAKVTKGSFFELTSILAMIIYALISLGIKELVDVLAKK